MASALFSANCWIAAGQEFHLPPQLLSSMAYVESSNNPNAIAYAKNGTFSVGLMQVNSSWFPTLRLAGINEADLHKPCTNVMVGAWILSGEVARYGYSWKAIGAYYAGPYTSKSMARKLIDYRWYAQRVLDRWRAQLSGARLPGPLPSLQHQFEAAPVLIGDLGHSSAPLQPSIDRTTPSRTSQ